jgi:hypothetical protein
MTREQTPASRRAVLLRGLGMAAGLGFVLAFAVQALVPALARLPGLLMCGGDEFELVLRSRTSYGVCADGSVVHYGIVLVVSSLVWSLVCVPPGLVLARWLPDKPARG